MVPGENGPAGGRDGEGMGCPSARCSGPASFGSWTVAAVPGGEGRRVANTLAEQLDFDAPPGAAAC